MRLRRNPCARRNDGGATTERKMRVALKRFLLATGWTRDAVEKILGCVERGLDGMWSYGTVRAIKDLAEFYKGVQARLGEPPDRRW